MRNSHVMGENFKGYIAIDGIFYLKNKILIGYFGNVKL